MTNSSERVGALQARHRHLNFLRMMEYLAEHPCADCGEDDPVVLDFDHLPGVVKNFQISRAVNGSTRSWQSIMIEIDKCEVVCANCHRRRTSARAHHRKHLAKLGLPVPAPPDVEAHQNRVPHGGGAKGRRACPCAPCRERRRLYAQQWRAKRKAAGEQRDSDSS